MNIPFWPVKPIRGGRPLDGLYGKLSTSKDWMCQAKMNGKRVIWDGEVLWSRQGNRLNNAISEALEGVHQTLDGELVKDGLWVFDLPDHPGTLTERWGALAGWVRRMDHPKIQLCPSEVAWQDVEREGWEGVVFKKRTSKYPKSRFDGRETADWVKYRAEWL